MPDMHIGKILQKTKATNDQQKSRTFGKLSMKIVSSIRLNGNVTDPQYNPALRSILEECKKK